MSPEANTLIIAAFSLAFVHTILGPDHYLPFVAMAKARNWSHRKTAIVTSLAGLGHVLSSIVLGALGVAFGFALNKLEFFESSRGSVAAWLLIIFGLVYFIWGLRQSFKNKSHSHTHFHLETGYHDHHHSHHGEHTHVHEKKAKSITPWVLFTIFLFGPCEPLIPLLMYPAAKMNTGVVISVAVIFGVVTIATMLASVFAILLGLKTVRLKKLERYAHPIAGFTVLLCGVAIEFLGL